MALGPVLFLVILLLPRPEGLSEAGQSMGAIAALMATDPPYCVDYTGADRTKEHVRLLAEQERNMDSGVQPFVTYGGGRIRAWQGEGPLAADCSDPGTGSVL